METQLTEIIMILDESGSMGSMKNDTIGGFNEFIDNQKKIAGKVNFTFIKFSDYYKIIEDCTNLFNVSHLNESTYTPSASTALLDAVGKTINTVKERLIKTPVENKPDKVIMVILTDGQENSSKEFTKSGMVAEMVKEMKEKEGWEFIFLGADVAAWDGGHSMGINTANSNPKDLSRGFKGLSNYTASYRTDTTAYMAMNNFNLTEEELDKQMIELQNKK